MTLGNVGLDETPEFDFVHPVVSLVNRSRGMPANLAHEARDCFSLWQTMAKHQTSDYPVSLELDPKASCPQTIAKMDIIDWEKSLKNLLLSWISDPKSPFDKVRGELSVPLLNPAVKQAQRVVERVGIDTSKRDYASSCDQTIPTERFTCHSFQLRQISLRENRFGRLKWS